MNLKVEYEAGAPQRELAVKYNRSYGAINRLLKHAGTNMRSRGGNNSPKRIAKAQDERARITPYLKEQREKGVSIAKLAAEIGRSNTYVRKVLNAAMQTQPETSQGSSHRTSLEP